jgi:hypothetical protein
MLSFAKAHYTECHYAECCGATTLPRSVKQPVESNHFVCTQDDSQTLKILL